MKEMLTVFTPTFNRAECLKKGYEALCRQTCKEFVWEIWIFYIKKIRQRN